MLQPPRDHFVMLMRRLMAYLLIMGAVAVVVWLFAFLRDVY
jgi:hypothetical protein